MPTPHHGVADLVRFGGKLYDLFNDDSDKKELWKRNQMTTQNAFLDYDRQATGLVARIAKRPHDPQHRAEIDKATAPYSGEGDLFEDGGSVPSPFYEQTDDGTFTPKNIRNLPSAMAEQFISNFENTEVGKRIRSETPEILDTQYAHVRSRASNQFSVATTSSSDFTVNGKERTQTTHALKVLNLTDGKEVYKREAKGTTLRSVVVNGKVEIATAGRNDPNFVAMIPFLPPHFIAANKEAAAANDATAVDRDKQMKVVNQSIAETMTQALLVSGSMKPGAEGAKQIKYLFRDVENNDHIPDNTEARAEAMRVLQGTSGGKEWLQSKLNTSMPTFAKAASIYQSMISDMNQDAIKLYSTFMKESGGALGQIKVDPQSGGAYRDVLSEDMWADGMVDRADLFAYITQRKASLERDHKAMTARTHALLREGFGEAYTPEIQTQVKDMYNISSAVDMLDQIQTDFDKADIPQDYIDRMSQLAKREQYKNTRRKLSIENEELSDNPSQYAAAYRGRLTSAVSNATIANMFLQNISQIGYSTNKKAPEISRNTVGFPKHLSDVARGRSTAVGKHGKESYNYMLRNIRLIHKYKAANNTTALSGLVKSEKADFLILYGSGLVEYKEQEKNVLAGIAEYDKRVTDIAAKKEGVEPLSNPEKIRYNRLRTFEFWYGQNKLGALLQNEFKIPLKDLDAAFSAMTEALEIGNAASSLSRGG